MIDRLSHLFLLLRFLALLDLYSQSLRRFFDCLLEGGVSTPTPLIDILHQGARVRGPLRWVMARPTRVSLLGLSLGHPLWCTLALLRAITALPGPLAHLHQSALNLAHLPVSVLVGRSAWAKTD